MFKRINVVNDETNKVIGSVRGFYFGGSAELILYDLRLDTKPTEPQPEPEPEPQPEPDIPQDYPTHGRVYVHSKAITNLHNFADEFPVLSSGIDSIEFTVRTETYGSFTWDMWPPAGGYKEVSVWVSETAGGPPVSGTSIVNKAASSANYLWSINSNNKKNKLVKGKKYFLNFSHKEPAFFGKEPVVTHIKFFAKR